MTAARPQRNRQVDDYIAKSPAFARPILIHLRELASKTCPEVVEKTKWGMPHFEYKGSTLFGMAAFKEYAALGFWKAKLLDDPKNVLKVREGMGQFGKMQSLKDLPSDRILIGFIKQTMKLAEDGIKVPRTKAKKEIIVDPPDYFMKALKKNKKALATYEHFSSGNKRDYIVWVTEAKTEATRERRLETAVEWMSEGKIRNWKYVKM